MPNLSQAHKQRWTPVPRIFPEFQYCIGSGEGGGGRGERTARYFPKEGTPKLVQMVVTNIITACASPSQGFFPSIIISMKLVFLKSHIATVHPNAVRLRTAKTIGYRIIRRVVLVSDLLIKTLPVL